MSMTTITNCPVYMFIEKTLPSSIKDGGGQAPFSQRDMQTVLTANSKKAYKAGGTLFMQNLLWLPDHRVPIDPSKITAIQVYYYPVANPPSSNPFECTIGVELNEENVMKHMGAMQRLSPEEPCHALLFSAQEAWNTKQPDDVLRRFRNLMLKIPHSFEAIPLGDDRFWRALNLREDFSKKYETLTRALRQKIIGVAWFKFDYETANNIKQV